MNRRLSLSIRLANRFRRSGIGGLEAFETAVHKFYDEFYSYPESDVIPRLEELVVLFESHAARISKRTDLQAALEYYREGLIETVADARLRWTQDPMLRDAITDVEESLRNLVRRVPLNHKDTIDSLERNASKLDQLSGDDVIDSKAISEVLTEATELVEKAWADEKYIRTLTEALNKLEVQYLLREEV